MLWSGRMNKHAYVTLLCNGEGYLPGVEALGSSLEASGTLVPKVLLVTPEIRPITRARLTDQGWAIREIEPIVNPNPTTQQMLPRFGAAYTKLRAWQLVEFDKVVVLDADTIVLQNVDDLFARPEIAAAPDFFLPDRFSSGVMVIEPRESTFERMVLALSGAESYDGGDQGFLNQFFENWYGMPVAHRLPVGYNMAHFIYQFMRAHPSTWDKLQHEIRIVHYLVQKPWRAKSTLSGASEVWWGHYFAVHPEKSNGWLQRVHEMEDWSFDQLAHWIVG
jgi:alpha-N-acetylglucosamine transferase